MFATENAEAVAGKETSTVASLGCTVATRTLGTKSRICSAVAMTCRCWE
ncbi:MAG TPA: hypothetical protein VGH39_13060 [Xanthobacteraceae bacterium]